MPVKIFFASRKFWQSSCLHLPQNLVVHMFPRKGNAIRNVGDNHDYHKIPILLNFCLLLKIIILLFWWNMLLIPTTSEKTCIWRSWVSNEYILIYYLLPFTSYLRHHRRCLHKYFIINWSVIMYAWSSCNRDFCK